MPLGQQRLRRVQRLVAAGRERVADDRVHDDLAAVLVQPGRVAAEDHRQPVGRQADAAKRPDVMVIECGGLDPTVVQPSGYHWLGVVAEFKAGDGFSASKRAAVTANMDWTLAPAPFRLAQPGSMLGTGRLLPGYAW